MPLLPLRPSTVAAMAATGVALALVTGCGAPPSAERVAPILLSEDDGTTRDAGAGARPVELQDPAPAGADDPPAPGDPAPDPGRDTAEAPDLGPDPAQDRSDGGSTDDDGDGAGGGAAPQDDPDDPDDRKDRDERDDPEDRKDQDGGKDGNGDD